MADAQRGNAEAYRALLDDIGPELMGFLRARVPDSQDLADLYQETFLALHRSRHTYEAPRPVEPWLFAIAAHVVARHLRRRRVRIGREVLVGVLPEEAMAEGGYAPAAACASARSTAADPPRGDRAREARGPLD